MTIQKIAALLESCASDSPKFPPTLLYNEGWLLRLALEWFSAHRLPGHPFACAENARWFSEALLPSPFLSLHHGDPLAEASTHADGVVGHFKIGDPSKTGLALLPHATQLVVLEAKLFSQLSAGVKNAGYFDQAARIVACIAEVLCRADRPAFQMTHLGFYVVVPQSQIEKGIFAEQISRESISDKVAKRVQAYHGAKDTWYREWFQPVLPSIKMGLISWEEIIAEVQEVDPVSAAGLGDFYQRTIAFNAK